MFSQQVDDVYEYLCCANGKIFMKNSQLGELDVEMKNIHTFHETLDSISKMSYFADAAMIAESEAGRAMFVKIANITKKKVPKLLSRIEEAREEVDLESLDLILKQVLRIRPLNHPLRMNAWPEKNGRLESEKEMKKKKNHSQITDYTEDYVVYHVKMGRKIPSLQLMKLLKRLKKKKMMKHVCIGIDQLKVKERLQGKENEKRKWKRK